MSILTFVAFATYVSREAPAKVWPILAPAADALRGDPLKWVLVATVAGVLLEFFERFISAHEFRKTRIQRVLDQLVGELFGGHVKENRCTLFKRVRGYQAFAHTLWRAALHQEERWPILKHLFRIRPWGTYLYVYARAKGNRNDRSCAVFRVFRNPGRECEGMAGQVWKSDVYEAHDLPLIEPGKLKNMKELATYDPGHPFRLYAEASNITQAHQLRARERYARHFYGVVIESTGASDKWGVLLLDSTQSACPWPEGKKGKRFEERFGVYSQILSSLLT